MTIFHLVLIHLFSILSKYIVHSLSNPVVVLGKVPNEEAKTRDEANIDLYENHDLSNDFEPMLLQKLTPTW